MDDPNKEMIILAREWRGYTQGDLADAISVAQGTVSKIEHGQMNATREFVDKVAGELRFPPEFFFQEMKVLDLPQSFFRRRVTGVPQKTLKSARARWALTLRGLRALLEAVEFPDCKVPQFDLKSMGISPADAAVRLRREWNVPIGPVPNVTALIEKMGVLVVQFDFGSERIDGMSVYDQAFGLPPVIFVNKDIPGDRQRFTTLHELCHVCCHAHLVGEDDSDVEREANLFAAEFLMPADQVIGHLPGIGMASLPGLKVHWKASMASVLFRADTLGLLSEARKGKLWAQFAKRGWKTKEPDTVAREDSELLRGMLRLHEQELGYSEAELCAILGNIGLDDMRSLYPTLKPAGLRLVNTTKLF